METKDHVETRIEKTEHEHARHEKKTGWTGRQIFIIAILGFLLVIATVQAAEVVQLRSEVAALATAVGQQHGPVSVSTGGGVAVPSNIQDLPQQVGGC